MTLARPMVLSTHTNDHVILRYCKIVVTKPEKNNSDTDSVIKSDFFLLFSKTMKLNWLHFISVC